MIRRSFGKGEVTCLIPTVRRHSVAIVWHRRLRRGVLINTGPCPLFGYPLPPGFNNPPPAMSSRQSAQYNDPSRRSDGRPTLPPIRDIFGGME